VRSLTLAAAIAALWLVPPAPAQSVRDVASSIELHYNRLATLATDFEQTLSYAGRQRASERGTLYLYRPQRMRWDYTRPQGKLLISDGEVIRMYNPHTNQVRTIRLEESADFRAPLAFLLGRVDFSRQFRNLALETIDGRPALTGEGRSGREAYGRVEFFYDPKEDYRITLLRVYGHDDSITEFRFTNERTNPRLDEDLFVFEAPEDAEILPETSLAEEN
jgi:outer membrane lipoprotein carrier protein